jgi:putative redox protein
MAETASKTIVRLKWDEDLAFSASYRGQTWTLDGRDEVGPSPVIAMAAALAGCMAIDIVHILTKGRHKVAALDTEFAGVRAEANPKRFTRIDILFTVQTNAPQEAVERAVELSHETYCSVWHSMRQDIEFHTGVEIRPLA